jgi:hypothetical protein
MRSLITDLQYGVVKLLDRTADVPKPRLEAFIQWASKITSPWTFVVVRLNNRRFGPNRPSRGKCKLRWRIHKGLVPRVMAGYLSKTPSTRVR